MTLHTSIGPYVSLSTPPVEAESGGPWNVIAYEVTLLALRTSSGEPVRITAQDIDQMVANFARYPKVPLVIEHADTRADVAELHPEWAEPHGHVVELRRGTFTRMVKGVETKVASLEARYAVPPTTKLAINGDPENGVPPTYAFCSVTFGEGIDEETNERIGTVLWSLSLTAHPRLVDLPRHAAGRYATMRKKKAAAATTAGDDQGTNATPEASAELGYWWGEIKTRGDVLAMLREVFELPVVTTEDEVLAKLDRLLAISSQPEEQSGVDVDDLVCALRRALRLDALKSTAEVIAEVRKALDTLPATEGATTGGEMSKPAAAPKADATTKTNRTADSAADATTKKEHPMKFTQLAAQMGVAVDSEEGAERVVTALARDGHAVRTGLKIAEGTPVEVALGQVAETKAELAATKKKLDEANEALAKAQESIAARETAELTSHVDAIALSKGWDEDTRALVLAGAKADPASFYAKHPRPSNAELAQRAQDGERLGRIELGAAGSKPAQGAPVTTATTPPAKVPETKAVTTEEAYAENLRALSKIADEKGVAISSAELTVYAQKVTPEQFTKLIDNHRAGL